MCACVFSGKHAGSCARVRVCALARVYVCAFLRACSCVCSCVRVCVCGPARVFVCAFFHASTCAFLQACVRVCVRARVCGESVCLRSCVCGYACTECVPGVTCHGHGTCNTTTGSCACDTEHTGGNCSQPLCPTGQVMSGGSCQTPPTTSSIGMLLCAPTTFVNVCVCIVGVLSVGMCVVHVCACVCLRVGVWSYVSGVKYVDPVPFILQTSVPLCCTL